MSLAFFPKSLQNKFGFCLGSQRQLPKRDNTLYLWPRSKGWMRAVKRTFNLQRLKSQIYLFSFSEFVYFAKKIKALSVHKEGLS